MPLLFPKSGSSAGGAFSREDLTQPGDSIDIVLSTIAIGDIDKISVCLSGAQQKPIFTKQSSTTLRSTVGMVLAGTEITVLKFD